MFKHSSAAVVLASLLVLGPNQEASAQGGWLRLTPAAAPPGGADHAMAYHSARGRVVLFGGSAYNADTWEWDGTNWAQRSPIASPSGRYAHAMAYDSTRRSVVLFGGHDNTVLLSDTWEWDGTNWAQRLPGGPSARIHHAMVYDSSRQRVLLFGGDVGGGGGYLSDTWEWDHASDWVLRTSAASPPARTLHAMAYDGARQRVVLFGGFPRGGGGYLSDTWEWDGSSWTLRTPVASPAARSRHSMTFDSSRGRVVLVGGDGGTSAFDDTWEWDGTNWHRNGTGNTPGSGASASAFCFDVQRAKAVLFGGAGSHFRQTWQYPNNSPSSYSAFGSGCAGSVGVPTLQPLGTSLPWLGERFTLLFNNVPPARPIFVFVGGSNTTWYGQFPLPVDLTGAGMTGCWLLVTGDVVGLAQPIVNFVPWHLDICQCPELLGMSFYSQGFVYDPPANPMGMTSTNGGAGVIGIR